MYRFLASLLLVTAPLAAASDAVKRLNAADAVVREIMQTSDKGVPQELLDKAQCVVVVPGLKKGAFIVGGKFGKGVFTCRAAGGAGWGAIGGVKIEGGSLGLQIGGSETDVLMLVMNERGAKRLLSSRFTLGGDASVAAGPVGRTSSAQTDASFNAEILTYSRSRGVFAGLALDGATLRQDLEANKEMYGQPIKNEDLVTTTTTPPPAAQQLLATLTKYSARQTK